MANIIPEIDDLTKGINHPDMTLAGTQETEEPQSQASTQSSLPLDGCWKSFLNHLESSGTRDDKAERLVCKLDRDLADSLDDCDIHNRCRSDLVNAIVRAFFETFLPQLAQYKREKKSLFMNLKQN